MKRFAHVALFLLMGVTFAGCASAPSTMPFKSVKKGETELGQSVRVYVGDTIYRRFDYVEQYEAYVSGSFKGSGVSVTMSESSAVRLLVDGKEGASITNNVTATAWGIATNVGSFFLIDEDSDGNFDKYSMPMAGTKGKIQTPIPVEWQRSARSKGFQRELIYQGRDGNNLKLFYREYIDDFARPAYNQEVQYDLGKSESIQFRGLTIRVEEANNEFLVATIESGSL
jgi:hypothetical protein